MAKKIKCTHQRCKWTNNKGIFSTHTDNRPVGESFSFLVRPETISELIEAASGSRRSAQEWTRSMRRSMKEAVRNGKIKARSSSMLAGRERWIFLVIHEFPKGPSQISWYLEIFVSASYSHSQVTRTVGKIVQECPVSLFNYQESRIVMYSGSQLSEL